MGKTNRMDEKKVDELVLGDTLSRFFTTRGSHSTFSHRNFSTMKYSVSFFFFFKCNKSFIERKLHCVHNDEHYTLEKITDISRKRPKRK